MGPLSRSPARRFVHNVSRLSAAAVIAGQVLFAPPNATAEPNLTTYPDIDYYTQVDDSEFVVADQPGIWMLSPSGMTCGIWNEGDFGCLGEFSGAPPGTQRIGWFSGDRLVHYDWSVGIRWPAGKALHTLPPLSRVTYRGTTCATTADSSFYCERGPFRFFVTPSGTWLNG